MMHRIDHYRRLAWALLAYSVLMGFSLLYLAEHYVADLTVGIVCALACHWITRRFVPEPHKLEASPDALPTEPG